ncbi:MAG: hypothetical protein HYZ44_04550 [Bacteroidetes bacterium]|nr:hypothetical protein [Bacteroidota bacterium]
MIRALITPESNVVSFEIPEEYIGKKLEVIAFTIDESLPPREGINKKVSFTVLKTNQESYQFSREEAYEDSISRGLVESQLGQTRSNEEVIKEVKRKYKL